MAKQQGQLSSSVGAPACTDSEISPRPGAPVDSFPKASVLEVSAQAYV